MRTPGPVFRNGQLERVLEMIDERLSEKVTVSEMAAVAHLSPFHFMRLFKRAIGCSPHAYLMKRRLESAKELLARTAMPMRQICKETGFGTQAHFSCQFRRATGTTPSGFRRASKAPPA